MTVETLVRDLELVLSDIGFSGLKNLPAGLLQKLEVLEGWMKELGMSEGAALGRQFREAVAAYGRGETELFQPADRLCCFRFYIDIILGNLDFEAVG